MALGVDAVVNRLEFVFDRGAGCVFVLKIQNLLLEVFGQAFQTVDLIVPDFDFLLLVFISEKVSVFFFLDRFVGFFALF